jgi:flagellar basal body P-ring protein FlgI
MVYTTESGTREPLGTYFFHSMKVLAVTTAGSYASTGVDYVNRAVAAVSEDSNAASRVVVNSRTGSDVSNGDIFLSATVSGSASDSADIWLSFLAGD